MTKVGRVAGALGVVAVLAAAGCTSDAAAPAPATASASATSAASAAPSASATPATSTTPAAVKVPGVVSGELARIVLVQKGDEVDQTNTREGKPVAGRYYSMRAACASSAPGDKLTYELRIGKVGSSDPAVASGEFACDGKMTEDGVATLPVGQAITLALVGDKTSVTSAYVVLVPGQVNG